MWLMTPHGFFSIVCKSDDRQKETLTVRSRVKSDLEALKKYLPNMGKIEENSGTDYRCRAKVPRGEVAKALAEMAQDIDYDNFKNEVAAKQGKTRAKVYGKVWGILYRLREDK